MVAIRRRADHAEEVLRRYKEALLLDVEEQFGRARLAGRTLIEGQDIVYAFKEAEARAVLAERRVVGTSANYPMLAAEAEATGKDARDLAAEVVAAAEAERARLAMLEGLRMGFKAQLKGASSLAEAEAIASVLTTRMAGRGIAFTSPALARRADKQQRRG